MNEPENTTAAEIETKEPDRYIGINLNPRLVQAIAGDIAIGVMKQIGLVLFVFAGVMAGANLLRAFTPWGMDDTDASPDQRSGMTVYTDYATGIQYLSVGGTLTPRLDSLGKIITTKGGE